MIVYLIGITGVGKSTVGKRAAARMGYFFVDLDAYIEMREGERISQLFQRGEAHFRTCETAALQAISQRKDLENIVVATGGGIVTQDKNIEIMRGSGLVLLLERPILAIKQGLNLDKRPLLKGNIHQLDALFVLREPMYKKACHGRIQCNSMGHAVRSVHLEVKKYENSHR